MFVNGRPLKDRYEGNDNGKKPDKDGNIPYWNVPMQHLSPGEEDKMKEKVKANMNEEDKKAEEQKLLRPLYLLCD
jgi:hypothetical protein